MMRYPKQIRFGLRFGIRKPVRSDSVTRPIFIHTNTSTSTSSWLRIQEPQMFIFSFGSKKACMNSYPRRASEVMP